MPVRTETLETEVGEPQTVNTGSEVITDTQRLKDLREVAVAYRHVISGIKFDSTAKMRLSQASTICARWEISCGKAMGEVKTNPKTGVGRYRSGAAFQ